MRTHKYKRTVVCVWKLFMLPVRSITTITIFLAFISIIPICIWFCRELNAESFEKTFGPKLWKLKERLRKYYEGHLFWLARSRRFWKLSMLHVRSITTITFLLLPLWHSFVYDFVENWTAHLLRKHWSLDNENWGRYSRNKKYLFNLAHPLVNRYIFKMNRIRKIF